MRVARLKSTFLKNKLPRQLSWAEADRYRERTMVERVYSRLKDEFGGRYVRVRGASKVMAHLMFGVLALTADQLLKLGAGSS
jgi:transposase